MKAWKTNAVVHIHKELPVKEFSIPSDESVENQENLLTRIKINKDSDCTDCAKLSINRFSG